MFDFFETESFRPDFGAPSTWEYALLINKKVKRKSNIHTAWCAMQRPLSKQQHCTVALAVAAYHRVSGACNVQAVAKKCLDVS
jgi:hypothetical protein